MDLLVGRVHRGPQRLERVGGLDRLVQCRQRPHHHITGQLAGGHSADAIGQRHQPGTGVGRVLVVGPHETDVGDRRGAQSQPHAYTLSIAWGPGRYAVLRTVCLPRLTRPGLPGKVCVGTTMRRSAGRCSPVRRCRAPGRAVGRSSGGDPEGPARGDRGLGQRRADPRPRRGGGAPDRPVPDRTAATEPILGTPDEVSAYTAYRMPATFAAVRSALPSSSGPNRAWRRTASSTLAAGPARRSGRRAATFGSLAYGDRARPGDGDAGDGPPDRDRGRRAAVRGAHWRPASCGRRAPPPADLVTVSYVLSEITDQAQVSWYGRPPRPPPSRWSLVEPGTPRGYARILAAAHDAARAGLTVARPVPASGGLPDHAGQDWCHFGARVNRSGLHRKIKDGELSYEDEKFSFVAASPAPAAGPVRAGSLRRPTQRKGLVSLARLHDPTRHRHRTRLQAPGRSLPGRPRRRAGATPGLPPSKPSYLTSCENRMT